MTIKEQIKIIRELPDQPHNFIIEFTVAYIPILQQLLTENATAFRHDYTASLKSQCNNLSKRTDRLFCFIDTNNTYNLGYYDEKDYRRWIHDLHYPMTHVEDYL